MDADAMILRLESRIMLLVEPKEYPVDYRYAAELAFKEGLSNGAEREKEFVPFADMAAAVLEDLDRIVRLDLMP